jgi:hypothetical protein
VIKRRRVIKKGEKRRRKETKRESKKETSVELVLYGHHGYSDIDRGGKGEERRMGVAGS